MGLFLSPIIYTERNKSLQINTQRLDFIIRSIDCVIKELRGISEIHQDAVYKTEGSGSFPKIIRCMNNRPRNLHKLMPKGS